MYYCATMLSLLTLRQNLHERKRQREKEEKAGGKGRREEIIFLLWTFLRCQDHFQAWNVMGFRELLIVNKDYLWSVFPFSLFSIHVLMRFFSVLRNSHKTKTLRGMNRSVSVSVSFVWKIIGDVNLKFHFLLIDMTS